MPRLRRVDCSGPGLSRQRDQEGWVYLDAAGNPVTDSAVLERANALVLPPAWTEVWICPVASGHIQGTGLDARGRRQYRYHDIWRQQQDRVKFGRMLDFASTLPAARRAVAADLKSHGMRSERVLACIASLLDLGFFRIGSEEYAESNQTYGLATMLREHVTVSRDGLVTFDYVAKSGKQRTGSYADDNIRTVITTLKRRRGGGAELFAYRTRAGWVDVRSGDINAYLRSVTGGEYTAKDFRTWHATVLMAVALAVSAEVASSPTARKRAISRAVTEVSDYLGNTPAVCRSSYIDPRVIDYYRTGVTIAGDLGRLGEGADFGQLATKGDVEAAVLGLLRGDADDHQVVAL